MPLYSDILNITAGERKIFGPFFLWNPSTGNRLSASTANVRVTIKDYPGGTAIATISSSASTAAGRLRLSTAASGRYYMLLLAPATSSYGGIDAWWQLRYSTAAGGVRFLRAGKLQIRNVL